MKYQVVHETTYRYESPVLLSQQLMHLTPRALAAQQVHAHRIEVTPMPHETSTREDYFGNPVTQIMLAAPHATLSVRASSQVEVQAGSLPSACQDAEPWESLRERLHQGAGEAMLEPQQFLFESPHVELFRSLLEAARYVSGYILTAPPPGKPRLIGADASHAWVSVWCGSEDWVDLDPTNNCVVAEQHVTLAWGRDFSDVTPMRGVVLGGGEQELEVRVTVAPAPA